MKRLLIAVFLALSIAAPAQAQFRATGETAESAYSKIREQAARTKSYLQAQKISMQAATVPATIPLAVIQHLGGIIPRLDVLAAAPGLVAYAQTQHNDATYDVAAQYSTMRKNMAAVLTALINAFPKDGTGYLLYQTLGADGSMAIRTFTAAQLAGAVTQIDTVIGSIQ